MLEQNYERDGKGWLSTPQPVSQETIQNTPLPPRFAIWEQHGSATEKKILLIDDFKRSEVNSLLKLHDASAPNALDAMFEMARAFAPSWPNITLLLTIMDFAHAYKRIGVDTKSTRFAVIALTDPQGGGMHGTPEYTSLRA